MWNKWRNLPKSDQRVIIVFLGVFLLIAISLTGNALDVGRPVAVHAVSVEGTRLKEPVTASVDASPPVPAIEARDTNGRTGLSHQQQVDGMTQAARDAGLDEATAQQAGKDAAALCNGNPSCLK